MRIAIFTETYFPYISGVVTHIETLKNGLIAQGHQVLIVTTNPKATTHYIKDGVLYCPSFSLKKIYGAGITNPVNLRRMQYIKEFNPNLLHIHTEFSIGLFGLLCARHLHKPIVYTLHTMYDDYLFYVSTNKNMQKMVKPGAHFYFRNVARKATEIIGPSPKVVEFLRRCGVERHINIVPNTVDLRAFFAENIEEEQIVAAKKAMGIQPGDISMLFVGRLGHEKSLDVLINFFADHCASDARYKLFIVGDGPELDNLKQLTVSRHVASQIRFLGRMDHGKLPPYFQACDLFTTASLSEINSISMLEAMASGLYVLQRLDIYNKEQITPGENGNFFIESSDFGKLLSDYAAKDPAERKAMRAVVTATTQRYGVKEFTKLILNVYERAIYEYRVKHPL
ncbi:MAG: glycosyltransferase [Pygmaiobacter sp.]